MQGLLHAERARTEELHQIVLALRQELTVLQGQGQVQGQGGKEPMGMTARRAFMTLPKYEGKAETYDAWKFQVGQFLGEEVYFTEFLQYLEGLAADPDEHEL